MRHLKHMLRLVLPVLVVGVMGASLPGAAKSPVEKANWNNVMQLRHGQTVHVVMKDAKAYEGKFRSATDESLVLGLETEDETLARQDILRISADAKVSRAVTALAGLGIGAGVGAALGQTANNNRPNEPDIHGARTGALVGMGIGAGIGALIHLGGWHEIYRAM